MTQRAFPVALSISALLAVFGACGGGSPVHGNGGASGSHGGDGSGTSSASGDSSATAGQGATSVSGSASSGQGGNGAASCVRSEGIVRDRAPLSTDAPFVHPGALSTAADLNRVATKVAAAEQPWKGSWDRLTENSHAQINYVAHPQTDICAGGPCSSENYMTLANDAAAAYQLALRYHVSGDPAYAAKAEAILDDWADTLKSFSGDSNAGLRAALYGYQLACAGELLRTHSAWDPGKLQQLLKDTFYPMHTDFLKRHNNACEGNYWANWDLANMAAILAIGVFTDQRALFNEALTYFYDGVGEGSIEHAIHYLHPDGSGQWQEAGRDQGHSTLGPMLLAVICEIAWNQGVDLYGYAGNLFLAGSEYVAAYNLGEERPFVAYTWQSGPNGSCKDGVQTVVSTASRGDKRAGWGILVNHYMQRRGIAAPYSALYAAASSPEGGGGDYGPNSGGYDSLGFTTLTHSLDVAAAPALPSNLRPFVKGQRLTLSWNGSAGATGYGVKRAATSCGPYETIATVQAPASHFVDESLTPSQTAFYVVTALGTDGESAPSAEVAATADDQLSGTVIGTEGSFGDIGATRELLFDGSLKNYFNGPNSVSWAGLDLGNGVTAQVRAVSYAPRLHFASRAVGGKFQGASSPDFSSSVVDLAEVTAAPPENELTTLPCSSTGAFRYLRYVSPTGGYGNLAEVQFRGTVIATP